MRPCRAVCAAEPLRALPRLFLVAIATSRSHRDIDMAAEDEEYVAIESSSGDTAAVGANAPDSQSRSPVRSLIIQLVVPMYDVLDRAKGFIDRLMGS